MPIVPQTIEVPVTHLTTPGVSRHRTWAGTGDLQAVGLEKEKKAGNAAMQVALPPEGRSRRMRGQRGQRWPRP